MLEIFAGTARFTLAIRDIGMAAMAADKYSTRVQSVHVACYDLNNPDQLQGLCDFISKHHHQVLWAHFAPSWGAASRARGRPLPKLAHMGIKVPRTLRSDKQRLGLDGLAGTDKIKAETANMTYDSTCLLVRLCQSYTIAVSLKNSENSLFWKITVVMLLLVEPGNHMIYFDNCCRGGARKKGTAWWSSVDWFTCLAARCGGSPFHEKWNEKFVSGNVLLPTHLEVAYPVLLCARLAAVAEIKVIDMGAIEIKNLEQQTQHAPSSQHRILLDKLLGGCEFKLFASEFVIHRLFHQGVFRVDDGCEEKQHDACSGEHSAHAAMNTLHFLWKWSKRARELNNEEMEFRTRLAPHLQYLLRGKRLWLLEEVLKDLGYPDHSLVDEIASGLTLHGWISESNVFPKETKEPEYTVDMVRSAAKGVNQMVFGQVNGTSDDKLVRTTWESALEEIEKQWVWCDVTSDDCAIGGYNKAYGTNEELRVHAIDQLAACLSWLCTDPGDDNDDDIVGRTYDLVQHSLRILGETALKKRKVVEVATHELTAIDFLARRVSEAETLKLNSVSLDILIVFTDRACEGESDRFGSVGGIIVAKVDDATNFFLMFFPATSCVLHLVNFPTKFVNWNFTPYTLQFAYGDADAVGPCCFLPRQRCCQGNLVQRLRRHQTWATHSATCHGGRKQVEAEFLVRLGTE